MPKPATPTLQEMPADTDINEYHPYHGSPIVESRKGSGGDGLKEAVSPEELAKPASPGVDAAAFSGSSMGGMAVMQRDEQEEAPMEEGEGLDSPTLGSMAGQGRKARE